jgi:hypothetical protein
MRVNGKLLIGQKDFSYTPDTSMIETSNKLTGRVSTFVAGRHSDKITVSGILDAFQPEATLQGYNEMLQLQFAGEPITVTFMEYAAGEFDTAGTTPVVGASRISASCLISNMSLKAPDNGTLGFDCSLQVTGHVNGTDTDFTYFSIAGQDSSTISTVNHTVAVGVPNGTDPATLVAAFKFAGAASCAVGSDLQVSGEMVNDFTTPVTYTVTAADGDTTQAWVVTVTVAGA